MLYFFMFAQRMLHAKPHRRPSWSLWKQGRGLAGAGAVSHKGLLDWRSALCSLLLWSLPLLWWLMRLFGGSGTATGCLSWEVWWPRTGSTGLAVLLLAMSNLVAGCHECSGYCFIIGLDQWDPWQTPSEEETLGHCRYSWSVRQKERTEKEKIRTWRIREIQESEQQHQGVHVKGKGNLDSGTV